MKNLPPLYQTHLEKYFSGVQYLIVSIVIILLQKHRQIKLEKLAVNFPSPIHQRSRTKKLQRFLSLPQCYVKKIGFFSQQLETLILLTTLAYSRAVFS